MNNEGKFKKSLSDLINSKEFEFDEANWEKASAMIDASKGVKGSKTSSVLISSLLVSLAVITGSYFLYPSSASETTVTQKSANSQPETSKPEVKEPAPTSERKTAVVEKEVVNINGLNNAAPGEASKAIPGEVKHPKAITQKKTSVLVPEQLVGKPASSNITNPANSTSSNQETIATIEKPIAEVKEEQAPNTTSAVLKEKRQPTPAVINSLPVVEANQSALAETKAETKPSGADRNEPAVSTDKNSQLNHAVIQLNEIPVTKEEKAEVLTLVQPNISAMSQNTELSARSTSEPPKGVGLYPLMPKADSAMLENDNETKLTYDFKEKPVLVSIEAGVSYLYGWKNPGNTDANGYNPFVGINFFQPVHEKLSVSLGLQYTSVSNLNYSNHVTKVSQLSLGEESTVTVFTPTKIHYLLAPLRVHYRANHKNIVGLGCNFAYLLTVESDVETYRQTLNATEEHTIYKDKGYTQGFSPLDVQVSAFYRHRLLSNLSFNAELFYGLIDTKDNAFFHSNVFERNTGLKISLVYNILKK